MLVLLVDTLVQRVVETISYSNSLGSLRVNSKRKHIVDSVLTIHPTMNNLTMMTSQLHPISFSQRLKFQSLKFQRLKFSSQLIELIYQTIRLQLSSSNQMMDLSLTSITHISQSDYEVIQFSSQQSHNLSLSSCCNVL